MLPVDVIKFVDFPIIMYIKYINFKLRLIFEINKLKDYI